MISKDNWRKYIDRLAAIDKRAADQMQEWIDIHGLTDTDALIEYAYGLVSKYGEASATLSCDMYDYMADLMDADVPEAIPAETATINEVARGVTWGKYHSPSQIPSVVSRQVRQTGADTMIQNAKRDNAEWAWVPQGDTCAFCITLASRGWQEASKTVLRGNHAEHIHQNCDCTFVIAFKERDKHQYDYIYDPDKYLEMYDEADGDINAMRRKIYDANKDEINEQKRDAYQAKQLSRQLSKKKKILWQEVIDERAIIREEKDFDHSVFNHDEKGVFIPSKTVYHSELPESTPYDIINIEQQDGTINRVLYNEKGKPWIRIHPTDHNSPDIHPPGGHLHIIEYGDDEKMPDINPDWLPLNDVDRIENADIL